MIGMRTVATAGALAIAVAMAFGAGAPRPEVDLGARRLVVERAERADDALAALEAALGPALDAARSGAARVVAGDAEPGPTLREAAELLAGAAPRAAEARRAVLALDQARRARSPQASVLPPATARGELTSIAAQLEATADAADAFSQMRERAAGVAASLRAALSALDAGDLAEASEHVGRAREDHEAIAAWELGVDTLPVWTETSDAMIGAMERILVATERGDAEAAEAAADDFSELGDDGERADRALRIAIGEGGSAVTAAPLGRLAAVLASIADARAAVASVLEGLGA